MLTQNRKMAKSTNSEYLVYNWTLPAFKSITGLKTCPMAGSCAKACYAKQGAYVWSQVAAAHERNLQATLEDNFVKDMADDIAKKLALAKKRGKKLAIRIHDSGDFYSAEYLNKWLYLMTFFPRDEVYFYAYTKMVPLFQSEITQATIAKSALNFRVIYSEGGLADIRIDREKHFHARIFSSLSELLQAGYANASDNDLVAALGKSKKIGLVYHGAKSKAINTNKSSVPILKAS